MTSMQYLTAGMHGKAQIAVTVGVCVAISAFHNAIRRRRVNRSKVWTDNVTVAEFEASLQDLQRRNCLIERVDLDRADVDNFALVLVKAFERKQKLASKRFAGLRRLWLRCRWRLFGSRGLRATDQLHLVLLGRRFSSKLAPMIVKPPRAPEKPKPTFEIELWDQGAGKPPRVTEVDSLKDHIKQAEWEEVHWDRDEEHMLLEIFAAQLRACLNAAGVEPWEYEFYNGGFAEKAGLSAHIHGLDWQFLKNADCSSFDLVPGKDMGSSRVVEYRNLDPAGRRALFERFHSASPKAMKAMRPLKDFGSRCRTTGDRTPLALFLGAPLNSACNTFEGDRDLASRVVYAAAMSGSWDGSQNLLGLCFNNAVANSASRALFAPGFFPNGRILLVPTETCKGLPFSVDADTIKSMVTDLNSIGAKFATVLSDDVRQWTDLKRALQPLFDIVTALPLTDLVEHAAVVETKVSFGKNTFAMGTIWEDLGMTMINVQGDISERGTTPKPASREEVPGALTLSSPFVRNQLYATERVFRETCRKAFEEKIRSCCITK